MQDKSDAQLLSAFASGGDQAAFREIVTRYTDLAYSAALRQVESSSAAADITQGVFTDLARKAGTLLPGGSAAGAPSLAGWLHRATRYAALNHLRDTRRRLTNERQAMEQLLTNSASPADWEQIRPALDEALDSLGDEDREALLLRYFKNQDFRAVGLALGVSDDAAQKRVTRAVERLREFFSRRNVTIGSSGLVVLISANAVQSAPAGLAAAISAASILTGTAVATSTTAAVITKTIAMTTLQKTIATATIAFLVGTGAYEAKQAANARTEVHTLLQQQSTLSEQILQLRGERDSATNRLAALLEENSRLKSNPDQTELLKLRGEAALMRQNAGAMAKLEEENLRLRSQLAAGTKSPSIKSPPNVAPQDLFPRESWTAAGYADPRAAFQSAILAVTKGDVQAYAASLSPDLLQARNKEVADQLELTGKSLTDLASETVQQYSAVTGYRILDEQSPSDNEVVLHVYLDGVGVDKFIRMKKIGTDWKVDAAP